MLALFFCFLAVFSLLLTFMLVLTAEVGSKEKTPTTHLFLPLTLSIPMAIIAYTLYKFPTGQVSPFAVP